MRLIDADKLLRDIEHYNLSDGKFQHWVEIQPTIEKEPKKGNWIVHKAPDKQHCSLVNCPFCGENMIAEADEYNFCPNCGADMREEKNEFI